MVADLLELYSQICFIVTGTLYVQEMNIMNATHSYIYIYHHSKPNSTTIQYNQIYKRRKYATNQDSGHAKYRHRIVNKKEEIQEGKQGNLANLARFFLAHRHIGMTRGTRSLDGVFLN